MHTLHRIYSWLAFPFIATVFIALQLLQLAFNLLNNFTYYNFFHAITAPGEIPAYIPPGEEGKFNYTFRLVVALLDPFARFWDGLKALGTYKF